MHQIKYKSRAARLKRFIELDAPPAIIEDACHLLLFAINEEDSTDISASTWHAAAEKALKSMQRHITEMEKHDDGRQA